MFGKLNDAYDSVKNGLEAQVSLATAEHKEMLADAKLALSELKDLMADLKDENRVLNERLKKRDSFVLEKGVYWKKEDTEKDQPYCPACYAKENVIPLQKAWDGSDKTRSPWHCPEKSCHASYNPWDYKEPSYDGNIWAG